MSYSEFLDQFNFYQRFPWGDDWQQAATIAHFAHAPHCKRPIPIDKIIPDRTPESDPKKRNENNWSILKAFAAAHNRKIRRANQHHDTPGTVNAGDGGPPGGGDGG